MFLVTCFVVYLQEGTRKVDYDYFSKLAVEYYRSDDPEALGNYLTGRLNFDKIEFPKKKYKNKLRIDDHVVRH